MNTSTDAAPAARYSRVYHPELADYLEARVKVTEGGCWEWQGWTDRGYGEAYHGGRRYRAHRLAFYCANDFVPSSPYLIRHICNNRRCCRPNHLGAGTALENTQDRRDAGRGHHGECNPSVKISEQQARAIVARKVTCREARERFGIGQSQFYRIRAGQKWSHLQAT